jgi:hypothetical protein
MRSLFPDCSQADDPEAAVAGIIAAAREDEVSLDRLIDAIGAPVYVVDERGMVTHFNCACADFAGRTPVAGQDRWCVTWRLYTENGTYLPHSECPMAVTIGTNRPVRGVMAMVERPDGTRAWFTPYPTPIRADSGALVGAVNILVDITDQRSFVLPYRCDCGASGSIRCATYDDADTEPHLIVAKIEGPFRVADEGALSCLRCGVPRGQETAASPGLRAP